MEARRFRPRSPLLLTFVAVGALGAACAVENGTGEMHGSLKVPACGFTKSGAPQPLADEDNYSKLLHFFVGEPFDSTTPRFPESQLSIRIQESSARLESADALKFWVLDTYEAARCIRGGVKADGTDDWDPVVCDRSSGEGRLLIGTENEKATAALALWDACPQQVPSAVGLGDCAGGTCPPLTFCPGRGSWIVFSILGSVPSNSSQPAYSGPGFKVQNGETIQASAFHLELCDRETVVKQVAGALPIPVPQILGTLDGSFSFAM